jgi:hypothetical protein
MWICQQWPLSLLVAIFMNNVYLKHFIQIWVMQFFSIGYFDCIVIIRSEAPVYIHKFNLCKSKLLTKANH